MQVRAIPTANARRTSRPVRLLPLAIAAAAVVFAVRLGGLTEGVATTFLSFSRSSAQETQASQPAGQLATAVDVQSQEAKIADSGQAAAKAADPAAESKPAAGSGDAAKALPANPVDISMMTTEEISVLQNLAARSDELKSWEQQLGLREGLIKATEQRLDEKMAELTKLKSSVEELLKQYDNKEDGKLKSLVTIYEKMKPKDAARILEETDMPTLLGVLERMKESKAAPILAAMDSKKAHKVTEALASRRDIAGAGAAGHPGS